MASNEFRKAEAQRLRQEAASGDQSADDVGLCMDAGPVSVKREIGDNAAEELSFHPSFAHSPNAVHHFSFTTPVFRSCSVLSGNDSCPPSLGSPTVSPSPVVKEEPQSSFSLYLECSLSDSCFPQTLDCTVYISGFTS